VVQTRPHANHSHVLIESLIIVGDRARLIGSLVLNEAYFPPTFLGAKSLIFKPQSLLGFAATDKILMFFHLILKKEARLLLHTASQQLDGNLGHPVRTIRFESSPIVYKE
jgi:hypothetical protein